MPLGMTFCSVQFLKCITYPVLKDIRFTAAPGSKSKAPTEESYVLLTVHLGIIVVNNKLDAQFFFMYVYFYSLHVSGSHVLIIRKMNFINTTSGICHSV